MIQTKAKCCNGEWKERIMFCRNRGLLSASRKEFLMAYFLFIDESGQDHKASPYEVLAGVAVADRDLWNLIKAIQDTEARTFGRRYSLGHAELKGKKLLSRKVFRKASQLPLMKD